MRVGGCSRFLCSLSSLGICFLCSRSFLGMYRFNALDHVCICPMVWFSKHVVLSCPLGMYRFNALDHVCVCPMVWFSKHVVLSCPLGMYRFNALDHVCICPMVWFSKHVILPCSCTQKQTQRQSSSIELWQFRTELWKGMCAT